MFLDFEEVKTIGYGFADGIFRVYKNKNPDIQIIPTNTNPKIEFMIKRSQK
ncbi:STAS-like domain-containing protein [Leptotrichia trevisanii]|uniref:STAS-like domain-containing protein n=1 Tax=Leptotrichia trevisanii TaxID=109328 RepID=UPI0022B299AD|nr:DUF4325 domain-containing protein [Leptotrichia trevisanii]